MLSIENPPPDPPYQQPKTISDERASENLPLPEVDPSNSTPFDHSTFPKFSLRDYVFNARSKDIRNNWPFALKNLQLCLKHGVKDLLPPFQPPDSVRNHPITKCSGGSSTSEFINQSIFDGEIFGTKENGILDTLDEAKLGEKQVQTCIESSSCKYEGENGFSSLVSSSGPSSSSVKTDNLLETGVEVETSDLPASQKTETKIKSSSKRCKLLRKSYNQSDKTSAADIAISFTAVSESMASKVCPVCKTFSSSSNTTLNAHIDQCLSMESTPKCTSDSKVTRYRIKPRKMKLMVDIYETARVCTLEELDKRNGTTWATLSGFPAQDIEKSQLNSGGKKQKMVPVHPEDIDNNDAVYIDANGTKLRILSRFNSPSPLLKVQDDLGSRKFKGVKGRMFHSAKRKKFHTSKQHKYLKVAAQSRKVLSRKGISSQVRDGQNQGKGSSNMEVHKIKKQVKPHGAGTLSQWACSKRTRLGKITRKEGYQPSSFKWPGSQAMIVDTDRSTIADSFLERSQVQDQSTFSENCVSSPESSEGTDNTLYEAPIADKRERSTVRKSVRSSFSGEMIDSRSKKRMKQIMNYPIKGGCFVGKNFGLKPHNGSVQTVEDYQQSDVPPGFNKKSSRNRHINSLKATKLSSLRREEILVRNRSSVTGFKSADFNKLSDCEKSRNHFGSHTEEEITAWHSESDHWHSLSEKSTENQSAREAVTEVVSVRVTKPKNRREREATSKAIALSSSESALKFDRKYEKEPVDSHVRMGAEFQDKTEGLELASREMSVHGEDVSVDSSSKLATKERTACFCKSMDSQFQKLNNNFKTRCGTLQSSQNCSWPLCGDAAQGGFSESSFHHGQEMFFNDEDRSPMLGHTVHSGELDSEVRQGNSFLEVDPISIPGPPGSFLPSPRDMRSEEFQGNSSLSSSWVHSCQDQHDFIDRDSSDSPISATSTISNSTASRSCLKYNNLSRVSGVFPIVDNDVGLLHVTCTGAGRTNGDQFNKVNKISIERGPYLSIINDGQTCCCQRAVRASHGIAVNFQEPELIRNQALALEATPAMGRKQQINHSLDIMSEEFSPSNSRYSMFDNMGFPVMKSPAKSYPLEVLPNRGNPKFPTNGNCESSSPSTSNPVLRLMGKNLMVVNKDDDYPVERPPQHPQLNCIPTLVPTFFGSSSQNLQNQASCSHPHWPQDSLKNQSLDVRLSSKSFRNLENLNMPPMIVRGPAVLFPKQQMDGGFRASHLHINEAWNVSERRQNEASVYNTNRTIEMLDDQQMKSATQGLKDCEAIFMANDPKFSGGSRTMQILTPGGPTTFPSSVNSVHSNSFSCYRPQEASPPLDKPSPICNSTFPSVASKQDHAAPVKWDCATEAPYVRRRGVF